MRVGGFVGSNEGEIINCFSSGDISGEEHIGGLVGLNIGGVTDGYSTGSVSGGVNVGGLAGSNGRIIHSSPYPGRISNCYSSGSVSGTSPIGGLVGFNAAGSIISCFWDMETCGLTNMCGDQEDHTAGCDYSFGKSTTEMQSADTFLEAGWDFVDETANGTDDIWWILEGQDYPRLWWEDEGN
jgi:hypothetical protein